MITYLISLILIFVIWLLAKIVFKNPMRARDYSTCL